jgi:PTS system fructose-specific IIA component/PTS system nitrogen regulatory IIA component
MSLLSQFIVAARLLDGGRMVDKREVVQQLLQGLADEGHIAEADAHGICEAILRREALGTTGIGNGIALPHARHAVLQHSIAILGVCRSPVEFDSLDGEPVDIVVLILGSNDPAEKQRRVAMRRSERMMRLLVNQELRGRLRQSTSANEVLDQFLRADIEGQ